MMYAYLKLLYLFPAMNTWNYVKSFLSLVTVFILNRILSDIDIARPDLFSFPFPWDTFFYLLTFSLYVSHISSGSLVNAYIQVLFLYPFNLSYVLCWDINPFTFKIVISMHFLIGLPW